jgi:glucose/arabinose dehydrogenase
MPIGGVARRAAGLALVVLAGCGGGGGSTPAPPAANQPPAFTSPATASVAENATGTIYTAAANDPNGNALSFSIDGGADAARFAISSAGALSFVSPPDFETPADADGNNSYVVRLAVNDGTATATLDLAVTVTNAGTDNFVVRRVGTGFDQPLYITAVPGDANRMFVVEKTGRIRLLTPATGAIAPTPFLNVAAAISAEGERGLLGFAPAPDFATTGTFYVYLTAPNGDIELRRYRTTAGNRDVADPATADVLLRIPHPLSNHNGGWIDFDANGLLYLAVGDGGGSGDPDNNGQNRNSLLGKILRLDVASDAFPADPNRDYAIPSGNPFANVGGAPEIWAYGLRNPFRNGFDRTTGNLFIADVGQGMVEEVNLMRPGDGGANFGWRVREGTQPFQGTTTETLVDPVLQYFHGSGPRQGRSITGGYVYRGPVEALSGHYFFADFVTGNIWSMPLSRLSVGTTRPSDEFVIRTMSFVPNQGTIANPASFGLDAAGNLYIVDFDGEIFRVEAA